MRFKIKREEFMKGLSRVQSVADRKNTMPILSNVLIEGADGRLTMTATDLEVGLRGSYEAEVEEAGGLTLSARKLFEIVRELPHEDVFVESSENNWATVKSGSAVFKFTGLAKEEFPSLPDMDAAPFMDVPPETMRELIKKTIFAAGDNDTRYVLNGIFMKVTKTETGASIMMVGTDGHRLATLVREVETTPPTEDGSAIIPKKSAAELKKLLDEGEGGFQMALTKNHIVFRIGSLSLVTRLIEGSYPNYEQVVPTDNDRSMYVDRGLLTSALRRVSLLSRERTNAVKLTLEGGGAVLWSQNPEMGEAREELAVEYEGDGLDIGFNAKYLLDALSVMDQDKVEIQFKDQLSPCIVTQAGDDGYRCVVMPLRI